MKISCLQGSKPLVISQNQINCLKNLKNKKFMLTKISTLVFSVVTLGFFIKKDNNDAQKI